ncbi:hypothetical protein KA005_81080 [bacterium]|nr:hypothetical protein [bacterium]
MPYIKQSRRDELDDDIENLLVSLGCGASAGDYSYSISMLIHHYTASYGLNYKNLNAAVGILECAKQEFIRKVVSPYEDEKIAENGAISLLDFSK